MLTVTDILSSKLDLETNKSYIQCTFTDEAGDKFNGEIVMPLPKIDKNKVRSVMTSKGLLLSYEV